MSGKLDILRRQWQDRTTNGRVVRSVLHVYKTAVDVIFHEGHSEPQNVKEMNERFTRERINTRSVRSNTVARPDVNSVPHRFLYLDTAVSDVLITHLLRIV